MPGAHVSLLKLGRKRKLPFLSSNSAHFTMPCHPEDPHAWGPANTSEYVG